MSGGPWLLGDIWLGWPATDWLHNTPIRLSPRMLRICGGEMEGVIAPLQVSTEGQASMAYTAAPPPSSAATGAHESG